MFHIVDCRPLTTTEVISVGLLRPPTAEDVARDCRLVSLRFMKHTMHDNGPIATTMKRFIAYPMQLVRYERFRSAIAKVRGTHAEPTEP